MRGIPTHYLFWVKLFSCLFINNFMKMYNKINKAVKTHDCEKKPVCQELQVVGAAQFLLQNWAKFST